MPYQKPPIGSKLNYGHPLARGLMAAYLFNEGSGDLVRNSCGDSDGKLISMAPMSPTSGWVAGPYGAALGFNGTGYVSAPNSPSVNLPGKGLTLIARVYPTTVSNNGILMKGPLAYHLGIYSFLIATKFIFRLNESGSEGSGQVTGATNAPTAWSNVAATYDGMTQKIFLNGVQDGTQLYTTAIATNSNTLILGGYYSTSVLFRGWISEIFIYNRGLSPAEIAYQNAFPYCMFDNQPDRRIWSIQEVAPPPPSTFTPRIIMIM